LALLLANLPARSNAQDVSSGSGIVASDTGNILVPNGSNWTNTVPGEAGGFSGGNTAAYNSSTNTIIFGYMQRTVSQSVAINSALFAAGTGIQVDGYVWGWNYWNSGMNRGSLTGSISLTGSDGSILNTKSYLMPQTNEEKWVSQTGYELFTNPATSGGYPLSSVSSISMNFTGKDDRFWAGYYGPRIRDPYLSLVYTYNPNNSGGGSTDGATSTTCTSYSTDSTCIAKNTSTSGTTPTTTNTESVSNETTPTTVPHSGTTTLSNSTPTTETHTASTPQQSSTPSHISGTTTGTGTSSAPANSTTVAQSSGPTKAGEASDSGKSSQPAQPVSLSTILSIVSNEQSRIGNVERSVVQQAVEQATKEAEKTQKDAEKIAGTAQQQSITASMQALNSGASQSSILSTTTNVPGQGTGLTFFSPTQTNGIGLSASRLDLNNVDPMARQDTAINISAISGITNRTMFIDQATLSSRKNEEVELPKSEGFKVGERNQVLNLIEEKQQTSQQTTVQPQSGPTVNQKVSDNDAAGNINLASIATQPRGYESYFSALPDVQFYAPKEIYKGQKTVDNARALRQLSSDTLHQKMIEQQYNRR
jgi:hypothetical protein